MKQCNYWVIDQLLIEKKTVVMYQSLKWLIQSKHFNIVQNNYQQASKVLYTFGPDKSFGQLINMDPSSLIELKTTDAEFTFIDVWFTDQENRPIEIEHSVNITLITGVTLGNYHIYIAFFV